MRRLIDVIQYETQMHVIEYAMSDPSEVRIVSSLITGPISRFRASDYSLQLVFRSKSPGGPRFGSISHLLALFSRGVGPTRYLVSILPVQPEENFVERRWTSSSVEGTLAEPIRS